MPNVYTYFNPVPEMPHEQEHALIVLWQRSWRDSGFEPVVLTHLHAEAHPLFPEIDKLVRSFPTQNPKEYEVACWHRWLAFATVGGGLMTDYDVIARGFDPEFLVLPDNVTVLDRGGVPCAVHATAEGAQEIVSAIARGPHPHNGKHYSDMYWFQWKNFPKAGHLTAPFGAADWKTAPAVHFSHGDVARERPGKDRVAVIRWEMGLRHPILRGDEPS